MLVKTTENPERGRFELYADDHLVGFVSYGVMSLPHTEVNASLRGRGLASTLIKNTLDTARSRGLAVLPLCPFVTGFIGRHPDYLSMVPADQRARFGLDTARRGRTGSA